MENCVLFAYYKVVKCTFCHWLYKQAQLPFHIPNLLTLIYSKIYLQFPKKIVNGVEIVSMFDSRKELDALQKGV